MVKGQRGQTYAAESYVTQHEVGVDACTYEYEHDHFMNLYTDQTKSQELELHRRYLQCM